eukprot:1347736-Amorphochlora_amoeboformis.AAC.1
MSTPSQRLESILQTLNRCISHSDNKKVLEIRNLHAASLTPFRIRGRPGRIFGILPFRQAGEGEMYVYGRHKWLVDVSQVCRKLVRTCDLFWCSLKSSVYSINATYVDNKPNKGYIHVTDLGIYLHRILARVTAGWRGADVKLEIFKYYLFCV